MERALDRNQEALPPEKIRRAYEAIYVPAQHLHFERDRPRQGADIIVIDDDRLIQNGRGP